MGVARVTWPNFEILGPPHNFGTNRDLLQVWQRHRGRTPTVSGPQNDLKVGVAWVTWPNFEILGPPYNFGTNRDTRFKFGTDIGDGPLLRPDHKWPLSGRGLGHVTESCTQRTNCLPHSWCYIKGKWYVYQQEQNSKYKRQKLKVYNDV